MSTLLFEDNKKGEQQSLESFSSELSHDIRAHLAIIKTNCEIALLDRETTTKEEAINTLASNLEEVDKIAGLMKSLFFKNSKI